MKPDSRRRHLFVGVGLILSSLMVVAGCESRRSADGDDEAEAVQASSEPSESDEASVETDKKGGAATPSEKATVGEPAPNFTLEDATGETHTLTDYRGKIVVLEWTSTRCPFVERHYEEKTMTKTLEKVGGPEKVVWLAIDSSHFASDEASIKWKEKYGVDFPFLLDASGKVGRRYNAKTTPHMYVIDKEGVLRYKGAIDNDKRGRKESPTNYVSKAVTALQQGESVETPSTTPYGCTVKYDG